MAWYSRLFPADTSPVDLTASQRQAVAGWQNLPDADLKRSHYRTRYVVVDVATLADSTRRDRLVALGALAVTDGLIDFSQAIELRLNNSPVASERSVLSGEPITASLMSPTEALIAFLAFAGKAPLIAFHASYAARVVISAVAEHLGGDLRQPWIDLAWVLSDLFRQGTRDSTESLDTWLAYFGVECLQRHDVVADAYATAKLLQITIAHAARKGFVSPSALLELEKARRHLYQSG